MSKGRYGLPLSRLSCFALAEEDGKAWFVRSQANGLYEFDKKENCVKLLMRFQNFSIDKEILYIAIEKVGRILVLAPASASKIVSYDLGTDKAEYLELMPMDGEKKVKHIGYCNFFKSFRYGNSVYLFGFEYPAVLKIDVKTRQIIYFTDWVKEIEQRISKMSVTMGYVTDYVVVDNCVWALCECADAVLCLDLRTDEIRVIDISSDLDVRCGICYDGNFWVTGYSESANKLLKYNRSFVLEEEVEICSAKKDSDEYSLSLQDNLWEIYPILNLGERLLLFSVYPRHVYEFDKTSQEVQICPVFEELLEVQDEKLHDMGVLAPRKNGNLICFITGNDFLWNEYDFVHDTLTRYEVRAEDDEEFMRIRSKFMAGRIFTENEKTWDLNYKLTLSRFMGHIVCMEEADVDDTGKNNNAGTRIHKECWEALDI